MGETPETIRVMSVDDHPLLREGIAALIAVQKDMTLVAEASDGREAIKKFRLHRPDVTLMDLQMPDMGGIDVSPIVVLLIIYFLERFIAYYIYPNVL